MYNPNNVPGTTPYVVGKTEFSAELGRPKTSFNIIERRNENGVWSNVAVNNIGPGDVIRILDAATRNVLTPRPMKAASSVTVVEGKDDTTLWVVYCKEA